MRSESGSWLCPLCMADSGFINVDNAAIWLAEHLFEWHSEEMIVTDMGRGTIGKRQRMFTCLCCKRVFDNQHGLHHHLTRDLKGILTITHATLLGVEPNEGKLADHRS